MTIHPHRPVAPIEPARPASANIPHKWLLLCAPQRCERLDPAGDAWEHVR
jgi:hypothetical protein